MATDHIVAVVAEKGGVGKTTLAVTWRSPPRNPGARLPCSISTHRRPPRNGLTAARRNFLESQNAVSNGGA